MTKTLPPLIYENLLPTRDYMQDATKVLGSLQRAFLPANPHDWQHGLEVGMRGPLTQAFRIQNETIRGSLDLVRHKVRLGSTNWALHEYAGPELLNNVRVWLQSRGLQVVLEQPDFAPGAHHFDEEQAKNYAEALWWFEERFRELSEELKPGLVSPILLYPHHFDISLSWFPYDDERQLNLGFSTGDQTIPEPYVYLTAYPEPKGFMKVPLPSPAYWQSSGFTGAILRYSDLEATDQPEVLLGAFLRTFQASAPLLA
ncbi:MAG: hypothetical protein JWL89_382 [Candidatus Saccharibacteria bacterium]|nr:hypothetical protein [Candidatus Saccharibacteria bacterium]